MTPTGTVKFILYQGASCTGAQLTSGLVPLVAGVAPAAKASYSASWTPPKVGQVLLDGGVLRRRQLHRLVENLRGRRRAGDGESSAATLSTTPSPTTGKVGVKGTFGDTATVTGLAA